MIKKRFLGIENYFDRLNTSSSAHVGSMKCPNCPDVMLSSLDAQEYLNSDLKYVCPSCHGYLETNVMGVSPEQVRTLKAAFNKEMIPILELLARCNDLELQRGSYRSSEAETKEDADARRKQIEANSIFGMRSSRNIDFSFYNEGKQEVIIEMKKDADIDGIVEVQLPPPWMVGSQIGVEESEFGLHVHNPTKEAKNTEEPEPQAVTAEEAQDVDAFYAKDVSQKCPSPVKIDGPAVAVQGKFIKLKDVTLEDEDRMTPQEFEIYFELHHVHFG